MRHAFTTIELITVLAVMAILFTLTGPAVGRSLSRAQSGQAASAIMSTHDAARDLALRKEPLTDGRRYGLRLWWDDVEGAYRTAVILRSPQGGPADILLKEFDVVGRPQLTADPGQAMQAARLAKSIAIFVLEDGKPVELRDAKGGSEVVWFFEPRTGFVSIAKDSAFVGPATIGLAQRKTKLGASAADARDWFGIGSGVDGAGMLAVPALLPGSGTLPGLGIAGSDGRNPQRFDVSATGVATARPVEGRLQ
jgi:type II secretory pathway pseudopilin PulG